MIFQLVRQSGGSSKIMLQYHIDAVFATAVINFAKHTANAGTLTAQSCLALSQVNGPVLRKVGEDNNDG